MPLCGPGDKKETVGAEIGDQQRKDEINSKVGPTEESLATQLALVRFVPRVGANVNVETTVLGELLAAHVALEGSLSWGDKRLLLYYLQGYFDQYQPV